MQTEDLSSFNGEDLPIYNEMYAILLGFWSSFLWRRCSRLSCTSHQKELVKGQNLFWRELRFKVRKTSKNWSLTKERQTHGICDVFRVVS